MNIQASKIEDALTNLNGVFDQTNLTFDIFWVLGIIAIAVALGLLFRDESSGFVRTFTVISMLAVIGLCIASSASYIWDVKKAQDGVEEAYKSTIAENFKLDMEDMDAAEFAPTKDDDTGAISEVKFGYTDKEKLTHYDLVFLFDEETNEPTLLKTQNVDSEVIESLKK